jgi:gluconate 2-dehydrogenase gamma chain
MTNEVSRRNLLRAATAAGAATAAPAGFAQAPPTPSTPPSQARDPGNAQARAPAAPEAIFFFNDEEARFVEAAIERLIPADPRWSGAKGAGVLYYIDRQLAGAYGAGARMYLQGPWKADAPPQQGYQLRHTPAELYRIAIGETRDHVRKTHGGREFADLNDGEVDRVLKGLETGEIDLPSLPSPVFFETLLANTIEGFFADPAYGGNREMTGWRMIGFPGAYAQYLELVDQYDVAYTRPPISFANSAARHSHISGHQHENKK